jgi:hypothetical protein
MPHQYCPFIENTDMSSQSWWHSRTHNIQCEKFCVSYTHLFFSDFCMRSETWGNHLNTTLFQMYVFIKIFMWLVSYIKLFLSVILCVKCDLCMKTVEWGTLIIGYLHFFLSHWKVCQGMFLHLHIYCGVLPWFYFLLKHSILEAGSFCGIKDFGRSKAGVAKLRLASHMLLFDI